MADAREIERPVCSADGAWGRGANFTRVWTVAVFGERIARFQSLGSQWRTTTRHGYKVKKLLEISTDSQDVMLGRGQILRFPGDGQVHETWLDVMIYFAHEVDRGMGLLVISGHKAGHPLVILPQDSGANGVSVIWLKTHFNEWIYETAPIEDVYVLDRPAAPVMGPVHALQH